MKKLNKVAVLFASAALATPLIALAQQTPTAEQFKYATGADQLACRRRYRLEERHQRTLLARLQLDAGDGLPRVRWRTAAAARRPRRLPRRASPRRPRLRRLHPLRRLRLCPPPPR